MANVVIHIKTYCPYCKKALALLESKGVKPEIHAYDDNLEAFEKLKQETGHRTVPQVFINNKFIGGSDDLADLERTGELDKLLS